MRKTKKWLAALLAAALLVSTAACGSPSSSGSSSELSLIHIYGTSFPPNTTYFLYFII